MIASLILQTQTKIKEINEKYDCFDAGPRAISAVRILQGYIPIKSYYREYPEIFNYLVMMEEMVLKLQETFESI